MRSFQPAHRLTGVALVAALLGGCVAQLSPAMFDVAPGDTLAGVERALATQGVSADRVDTRLGIVETPWESTGANSDGTLWVHRYLITVSDQPAAGHRVVVAMDLRTCDPGLGTNPHSSRIDGSSCARLPEGTTPQTYQGQLDDFAARLRSAMGGQPVVQ